MNSTVQLVDALAWPLAAVAIAVVLRAEVRALLGRLSTLKYKDLQADFERKLDKAEKKAETIPPPQMVGDKIYSSRLDWETDAIARLTRIAEVSPRAAVTEAWAQLESAIRSAAETLGLAATSRQPSPRLIGELLKRQTVSEQAAQIYPELRALRNEIAHVPEFSVDYPQADRYIRLAVSLAGELHVAKQVSGQQ